MKNLTVKVPDHKLDFFLELIHDLGFVKVETQESANSVLSQEQIQLVNEERIKIKNNPDYLIDWNKARETLN